MAKEIKTLSKLTEKQEGLLQEVRKEYLDLFFKNPRNHNEEKQKEFAVHLYELANLTVPPIHLVASLSEAQELANKLNKTENQTYSYSWYGDMGDYGWVAFYDFFTRIGILDNPEFNKYKDLLIESGSFTMIQFDEACIVVSMPSHVNFIDRDGTYQFHDADGPAIKWDDGSGLYFLYGVRFEKELFEEVISGKMDLGKLLQIQNIEQRYASVRLLSADRLIKESGAKLISEGVSKAPYGGRRYKTQNLLYLTTIDDIECRILTYTCPSTGRAYFKFAMKGATDADQAQAELHNMTKEQYLEMQVEG